MAYKRYVCRSLIATRDAESKLAHITGVKDARWIDATLVVVGDELFDTNIPSGIIVDAYDAYTLGSETTYVAPATLESTIERATKQPAIDLMQAFISTLTRAASEEEQAGTLAERTGVSDGR